MSRGVLRAEGAWRTGRVWSAGALLASIVCLPAALPAQDTKVTKLMDAAQAAYDNGRYQEAFDKFQRANQEASGAHVPAILGALEASLSQGRYDSIILQISGTTSNVPAEQTQLDSLVGRAHLLTAYVVDPTAGAAARAALAQEHRRRALTRLTAAAESDGDWSVRSRYYLAEAKAALGDDAGAREDLETYFGAGGAELPEAASATALRDCLASGKWMPEGEMAAVPPAKETGASPRRIADGASVVAAVLAADGRLTCMRMLPPMSARANENVYTTLAEWTYRPAQNEAGEAVATPYTVTLDFTPD